MAEKREGQGGRTPDAAKASPQLMLDLSEIVRAEVGKLTSLHVPPDELGRVEIRRVAGQAFDGQPRALSAQVVLHGGALMRRQAIPDEDDPTSAELPLEVGEEVDEGQVVVTAGAGLEEEPAAPEVPPKSDGDRDGELLPIEGMDQDRGFAAGRPGAPDGWPLRDAALVLEDDPGAAAPSVFFTVGQRVVIQCWMAASFRSRARLAGRCNVHFIRPKTRQTWPG